ncbi:MAG: glycosyltransferase family 1 protein [Bacillaceae bacterium]|nr:glycosyltransferase family 1 protein [Bacillaceae bacterium]
MEKLKVLHVVGAMNRAGTETMLMNVFRYIDRTKIQFDFISYSQENAHYDDEIRSLGGNIFKLNRTTSLKELFHTMKQNGPYDVVHSHTMFHCGLSNLAAMLAGVKLRISHAHTTLVKSDTFVRKLYIHMMRALIRATSTHLLACSKESGTYLYGQYAGNIRNYSFFPNLIDYKQFSHPKLMSEKDLIQELNITKGKVIGHIGRFIDSKNHLFLLEVMKEIVKIDEEFTLLLVGDGDLRGTVEQEAMKLGIFNSIRFIGIREDVNHLLNCMDVFVFPSKYEGLGLVLLEAQASGVPCVVSEAIQPEADLGIGLFTKLSLQQTAREWAEVTLHSLEKKETNKEKINEAFENSDYSLSNGIQKLTNLYKANDQWREI